MLVADLMTARPVTVRPESLAEDALRLLSEASVTALPVVGRGGRLVGIVSETDLLRGTVAATLRAARSPHPGGPRREGPPAGRRTVADVMTRTVVTASPGQDAAHVVRTMLARDVHSVPVVLAGRVVGILSASDVVRAMARDDAHITADVSALLANARLRGWRCVVESGRVRLIGGPAGDGPLAGSLARSVQGVRSVTVETEGPGLATPPQEHDLWPI